VRVGKYVLQRSKVKCDMAKVINADEKNDRIEPEEAITHNTADRTDVMTGDLDL